MGGRTVDLDSQSIPSAWRDEAPPTGQLVDLPPAQPLGGADLEVVLVDVPGGTYSPGDSIVVHNVVTNIGSVTSSGYRIDFYASTNTTITSSDHLLGFVNRSGLGPGATHNFNTTGSLPDDLPADDYYIGLIVTVSPDASTGNNRGHDPSPITVVGAPADLSVVSVDVPGGTYSPGDSIVVNNVITNEGGTTSSGYRVDFYASTNTTITTSDYHLGFVNRGGLDPGDTDNFNTTGNLPDDLPADDYYIGLIVTVSPDADTGNNKGHDPSPIVVQGAPADLAVQSVDAGDGNYSPGDDIVVNNVVSNVGGTTSSSYRVDFYASINTNITSSDFHLGFVNRGGLAGGDTDNYNTTATFPTGIPGGSYYIGIIVTVSPDADTGNNTGYEPTTIFVDFTEFGGTVRDSDTNQGISGASVSWGSYSTSTNSSGGYNLTNLPCETHTLVVSKSGYQTYSQSYTPACNTSNLKNVDLDPNFTEFGGTVRDSDTNQGISGASVSWGSYSTSTNSSGGYNLTNLPCETHTLVVSKSGYQTYSQSYTPACNTSNLKNVDLDPNFTEFGGTVRDSDTNQGISGASVSWGSYSTSTTRRVATT